jgi:hypothetical protein
LFCLKLNQHLDKNCRNWCGFQQNQHPEFFM